MTEKAFTMRSGEYCGGCGSFDLVEVKPDWVAKSVLRTKPAMYCYGCDRRFSEKDFAQNAIRTLPLTAADFFFQTNLRAERLKRKQIRPVTQVLSVSLITGAIAFLFLVKTPNDLQTLNDLQIEWAVNEPGDVAESYEARVVKSLQLEFEQLVKTN